MVITSLNWLRAPTREAANRYVLKHSDTAQDVSRFIAVVQEDPLANDGARRCQLFLI